MTWVIPSEHTWILVGEGGVEDILQLLKGGAGGGGMK